MHPKESQPAETSFSVDITWPRPLRLAGYLLVVFLFALIAVILGNIMMPRTYDVLTIWFIGLVVMTLSAFVLCLVVAAIEITLRWRRLARKDIIPG